MRELFNDLVTGLNEAIEFEKGKGKARTHTFIIEPVKRYNKSEIKAIRTHAGMTQAVFADYMGVSSKTVEAWEKGTNHPTGSACRLLDILSSDCIKDVPFIKSERTVS
ncbi:MAG: helix-turn-helix domain-containing protein [Candidatus Avilachnospira sp.]|jgi:putative transcriptional regulator